MDEQAFNEHVDFEKNRNDNACEDHRASFGMGPAGEIEDCYQEQCYVGCPFMGSDEGCG
jgi:hypothetical protein